MKTRTTDLFIHLSFILSIVWAMFLGVLMVKNLAPYLNQSVLFEVKAMFFLIFGVPISLEIWILIHPPKRKRKSLKV